MAWIQVHQQLKDHRKLLAAADELEIEPAHMLGLLTSFWLWALDNAPSGSLDGISNRMIARAAQWNGAPDVFVDAMAGAGLLDKMDDETLAIHDWYEYAGKLIDQREAEKNRSRARRAAAAAAAASTSDDRRTTTGQTADGTNDDQKKTAGRVKQSTPKQTKPEQTRETEGDLPHTPKTEAKPDAQECRFAEFWTQYPKKVGKKAAQNSWRRIKPDAALFERIMQAITAAKASDQWNREGGRFIPNPSTWLNQGRWDDELPAAGAKLRQTQTPGKVNTMDVLAGIIADEEGGDYL